MKSRRAFVRNTTLATVALLASRSVKAIASVSQAGGKTLGYGQPVVFLHNSITKTSADLPAYTYFSEIRNKSSHTLVMNAGKIKDDNFNYDAQACQGIESNYQVINKGGIKTGIITVGQDEKNPIDRVNQLAKELKHEKNCQLVVCISHLGYKKATGVDDLKLASHSSDIDIIFGGNVENAAKNTMVILNKNRGEVIVQSSRNEKLPCGKLEILFDNNGNKRFIHVAAKLYRDTIT